MNAGVDAAAAHPRADWSTARRTRSAAERLALTAVCSAAAAWVHENHDPGALCPLRRITGIPCPLCGSTTLFMEAGAGHWSAALAANPFTVVGAVLFLAAPLLRFSPVDAWVGLGRARALTLLAVVLAASWIWQLHRFGFL